MLPEIQSVRTAYPLLESPRTVRVKFCKTGNLQYISHLDLQRTFSRVLVRAGIPMWYTQGFNPHAKITFGLPLSVGAESLCEYLDLKIARDMPCSEIKERLNGALTEEMHALEVYEPPVYAAFSDIVWASYQIELRLPTVSDALAAQMQEYLTTSPLMTEKKSKSGVRLVDMTTLTRSLTACADVQAGAIRIEAVLSVAGADYLNPAYLIRALQERFGILPEDDMISTCRILRTKVYLADGKREFY